MIRARGIVLVVVHLYLVKVLARITHEQGLSLLYCLTPLLSLGIKISDSYKQDPRMTNNIYEMVSGLIFGLLSTVDEFGPTTLRELPLYIQQSKQIETIIRPFIALLMLCYLLYGGVSGWFEVFSMAWPELAKLFALSITLAGLYLYVDPSATETTLISVFFVCFLTAVTVFRLWRIIQTCMKHDKPRAIALCLLAIVIFWNWEAFRRNPFNLMCALGNPLYDDNDIPVEKPKSFHPCFYVTFLVFLIRYSEQRHTYLLPMAYEDEDKVFRATPGVDLHILSFVASRVFLCTGYEMAKFKLDYDGIACSVGLVSWIIVMNLDSKRVKMTNKVAMVLMAVPVYIGFHPHLKNTYFVYQIMGLTISAACRFASYMEPVTEEAEGGEGGRVRRGERGEPREERDRLYDLYRRAEWFISTCKHAAEIYRDGFNIVQYVIRRKLRM